MLEAKFLMRNNKDLLNAFSQARSYALIMQAETLILCDKECMIIYENKNGFDRSNGVRYYWGDFEKAEVFQKVKSYLIK